jgi:Protein of unknown function (DUF3298)/Deacetylase PdaC
MKKLALIILSLVVFAGCEPVAPVIENEPEQETPTAHSAETVTYEDESGLYIINIEYPKLDYTEEVNTQIKDMIDTEIDGFIEEAESLELTVEEIEEGVFGKSGLWINYTVYLLTDDYISIAFESSIYNSGAAHPYSYTEVFNYDVVANKELILMDMFVPDTNFWAAISATVIPRIKLALYEDEFVNDEWIDEGAGPEPENFTAFNITEDGFVFHFFPYQVAAYAAGPQKIEVDFEDLGAILALEWKR